MDEENFLKLWDELEEEELHGEPLQTMDTGKFKKNRLDYDSENEEEEDADQFFRKLSLKEKQKNK